MQGNSSKPTKMHTATVSRTAEHDTQPANRGLLTTVWQFANHKHADLIEVVRWHLLVLTRDAAVGADPKLATGRQTPVCLK